MLARAGAQVIICARSSEELEKLSQEMHGENHIFLTLNLEDIPMVESKITNLVRQQPIHILVNNSGGPPGGPLLSNTIDEFEAPFKRHLHAAHTITRILTPVMEKEGYGRIVNIISTSVREPIDNIGLSNTLRGAMGSWAKSLSRELNPCITINNICLLYTSPSPRD